MLTIIYSFNKKGYEAEFWQQEIAAASDDRYQFVPFNHDPYLATRLYLRAQLLDNLYATRHPELIRMYSDFEALIRKHNAGAVIVDNCPPYHPDYLRKLCLYKVLRTTDGPLTAYDRDFAYIHAYHLVLYHSPAYSRDMGAAEKLRYCGARDIAFWPLALFDAMWDRTRTEETIVSSLRDIDIIFIGSLHRGKMPILASVAKAFGRRCRIYGLTNWKRNLYFILSNGVPRWIRPIAGNEYVKYYQRAKVGFNVHNRGDYTVGGYRLFELPANGVMQISDGGEYLGDFFRVGEEIVGYQSTDDLIEKLNYYLVNEEERRRIACAGFRRVMKDHRIQMRLREAGRLIEESMSRVGWGGIGGATLWT
jgi:spore maturation protein CgeB